MFVGLSRRPYLITYLLEAVVHPLHSTQVIIHAKAKKKYQTPILPNKIPALAAEYIPNPYLRRLTEETGFYDEAGTAL